MINLKMSRVFTLLLILLMTIPVFAQEEPGCACGPDCTCNLFYEEEIIEEIITEEYDFEEPVYEEFYAEEFDEDEGLTGEFIAEEFDEYEDLTEEPFEEEIIVVTEEYEVPQSIQNNQFYRESVRLSKLAQDTYDYGDYEASAGFAEEAIYNAQLSDEFVATQLLAEAKRLVEWADYYNIAERHPNNVQLGKDHYENALALHSQESWNESSDFSIKSIEVLGVLLAGTAAMASDRPTIAGGSLGAIPGSGEGSGTAGSPNQYTVRTWAVERDCFWNIAGYEWVYNDVWQWRRLYEANKHKIPDPNNPDLIEPGTVLDIPR